MMAFQVEFHPDDGAPPLVASNAFTEGKSGAWGTLPKATL